MVSEGGESDAAGEDLQEDGVEGEASQDGAPKDDHLGGPPSLHTVLREPSIRLLSWISIVSLAGAFPTSKATRELLSSRVAVTVSFDIRTPEGLSPKERARRRQLVQRTRSRLPHTPAEGPLRVYVQFALGEVPFRSAVLNRILRQTIPMVEWTDVGRMRIRCRGELASVDVFMRSRVEALGENDMIDLLESPQAFKNLVRVSMDISTATSLPPDFCMPGVRRLKLVCFNVAFTNDTLVNISQAFPGLSRLHLEMLPKGLLPLCGPGFSAPSDLRLSLLGQARTSKCQPDQRKASLFVASHLLTLPFSWNGTFFQNVARLQMTELSQEQAGLTIEQLTSIIQTMFHRRTCVTLASGDVLIPVPCLRRLGTVSLRVFQHLDIAREDLRLEELALVMDTEDHSAVFRSFLVLEQAKRCASLRRLAVHLLAGDGVGRPRVEVETAIVAGWHTLATTLLRPDGFVAFSFGHLQLSQTALAQLAWFNPEHFCIDWIEYEEGGRLPGSTPLERPLAYSSTEEVARPNGTLVAGSLRPSVNDRDEDRADLGGTARAESPPSNGNTSRRSGSRSTLTSAGQGWSGSRPPTGLAPKRLQRRISERSSSTGIGEAPACLEVPVKHPFLDMSLVDAYENLVKYKHQEG